MVSGLNKGFNMLDVDHIEQFIGCYSSECYHE